MITIIGNGESRKGVNIDLIKGIKVGCNAIYLYNNVDYICAMDTFWRDKISSETTIPLIGRKHNTSIQPYLEMYEKGKWKSTSCPYRGYCSGITALDYMCHSTKDDIYLLGFDFGYTGEKVNHIYKGQEFHPPVNNPAQNENIFLNQCLETIKRYPLRNIYWVTDSEVLIKIKKISIERYKELSYELVKE